MYLYDRNRLYCKWKLEFHSCNAADHSLTLRYPIREWELNHMSTMHGGLIAAAIDTTSGAAYTQPDRMRSDPHH